MFALFGRAMRGLQVSSGLAQDLVELIDTCLDPGPDVVRAEERRFEGESVCPGHVFDVYVVAGLAPLPLMVDPRPAARFPQKMATTPASQCGS